MDQRQRTRAKSLAITDPSKNASMRHAESHRPENTFQMTRRPDRNISTSRPGREDSSFDLFGSRHTDNRPRQGVVSSAPFFNTVPRRTGPQQQLLASPAREPPGCSTRGQSPAQKSWNPLGMQLQMQMRHLEKHREGSALGMNQQAEPGMTPLPASKESLPFQSSGKADQRQRAYTKPVGMSESPTHHVAKPQEKPGQRNAMMVSQQEGPDVSALQAATGSHPAEPSDGAHPDKVPDALTASVYFCETETSKTGRAEEHTHAPAAEGSSTNLQQAFVSAHEAWVSLETELRVKKNELEQAQKSLAENSSLISSLRAERDTAKSQLQQKKNEHLKLEAVIVGLQERSSSHEKQLEGLLNKLVYFHELQGHFNNQLWAASEECNVLMKGFEELTESYDMDIKRLEMHSKQLSEDVVRLQEEIVVRERELEAKAKLLDGLSEKCESLENQVAEASEWFQKMEQEKARLEKDLQVLIEEHSSVLREKDDIEEALRETQMHKDSIVSHVEETRSILEQNVNVDDDQSCPEVYQLDRNLAAAITVRRVVEKLIVQCKTGRERLDQALSDIKSLQAENEKLSEDNKGMIEKTAAFEDVIAAKQGLESELSEERLRMAGLVEQLKQKEELLTSGLQKACSALHELKEESNSIIDDITKKFAEWGNDMEVLATNLSSEISAKAVLLEELENMTTLNGDLERRVSHLVAEVESRDKSLNQRKEEVDDLTEDVTNLRQLLETAMSEIDNLTKSSALSAASASEQIQELRAQLEQKSTCAAHLSEKLQETEKLVADLKEEVQASSAQVDQLRSENETHMKNIRQLSADLEKMKLRPEIVNQEVQTSQAEESDRNKELLAKLQEAEDKFNVLEIDFNRMNYEREVRYKSYEDRVQDLKGKLHQAGSNYARLEKELENLRDKEYVQEQQRNSVAKQLQDIQTTNNIMMSNMRKEHEAAVQKLKNENTDLRERLKDLTACLEKTRAQAQEEKSELQKSRDQAHEEMKCIEAKLENEVSKKEEMIDKLCRQLRVDELKHEEELMNLRKCIPVGHGNCPETYYKKAANEPFITNPEQCKSPSASPGTRQRCTVPVNVVPLTLQPIEQAVQPVAQPTVKRAAKRAPRQAVRPVQPSPVQTRRKSLLPLDVDNMFDSSNSSIDANELTTAVDRALHTVTTQEEDQIVDSDDPKSATPKRCQVSPVANPTTDMPPPQQSPASKKRKFFKSQPEWKFGTSNFR